MTKIAMFNSLIDLASANEREDLVEFINKEIASLEKKRAYTSPKDKANAKMNEELKDKILEILTDKGMLTSDLAKVLELTPQKTTSLLTTLLKDGKVAKEVVKGKSYYSKA